METKKGMNKRKRIGLLAGLALVLPCNAFSNSYNYNASEIRQKEKKDEIENLIKEQYNNKDYNLMDMKQSNKGNVAERPFEKDFKADRKNQEIVITGFGKKTPKGKVDENTVSLNMTKDELMAVADRIFLNETGGNKDKLVHWNSGENFPSLGIGHFIWFKPTGGGIFGESFPDMVSFYRSKGVKLPSILEQNRHSPWKSRTELMRKKENGDREIQELIEFFDSTKDVQVMFIYERLQTSFEKMLEVARDKDNLRTQFNRMVNTPNGLYALIDYVNFKGEGLKGVAEYNYQAWGLRQVLENMKGTSTGYSALVEFSESAKYVLERRVRNAPRNESKWLKGWFNRIDTYKTFELKPVVVTADAGSKNENIEE